MIHRFLRSFHRFRSRLGERLRRLGDAITSPIERTFAATFGRLFEASAGFENVEGWLLGLVKLLTWPLRILWRGLVAIVSLVVPRSVRSSLAGLGERTANVNRGVGRGLLAFAERFNLDVPIRWLVWLLQPLWRPVAAVGGFLYAWLTTRPYRQMLWGLPALVLLAPIAGAAVWGVLWGRGSVAAAYRVAVREAREAGDYDRMELFEKKLAQLGIDTQATDYKTALALAEQGELAAAYERMQRLAPTDRLGYIPAHAWIVEQLMRGKLEETDEEALRLRGLHLDRLEKSLGASPSVKFLRSAWFADMGQLPEAAEMLKPLVREYPLAAMQRLAINITLNKTEEAKADAHLVASQQADRHRRNVKLTTEEYRMWAHAEGLLEKADAQAVAVQAWKQAFPNDPLATQGMAELARRAYDEQVQSALPDARLNAQRIIEAAELGSDAKQLGGRVADLYRRRASSPDVRATLEELVNSQRTPGALLQLMGTHALMAGENEQAKQLLKRAVEKDPNDAIAWNNYACVLLSIPDGNMEEALAAVARALAANADSPQFRETRGQIYVRLERWAEAVTDLEFAVNGLSEAGPVHRSLATAYAALGQDDLANIHRQQAQ